MGQNKTQRNKPKIRYRVGKKTIKMKHQINASLTSWLQSRQENLKITKTTTTPNGQTVDWVPIESQTHEKIATPPPTDMAPHVKDASKPTKGADINIGEAGPEGHVPILRPDLSKVKADVKMEDLFTKRGGLKIDKHRPGRNPMDPNPAGYFHCSTAQTVQVYGCDAWLNVWDPQVDIPSSPGDDHSISQTWLLNYQKPKLQTLEGGLTVDHSLNGDASNHLFTYFTTNGYTADGDNIGGYNRLHKGWIQYNASIFPGIRINGSSVQGGGSQLEIGIKYQLYQGNWWFGFNNNESGPWIWLGYYPASLFAGGIGTVVNSVSFGGEVYSALANPCATTDQMGSGRHAATGFSHAAFQRNMHNQTNAAGTLANFNGVAEVDTAASGCVANGYTIQTFMNSGSSWASYQFYGGPSA